MNYHEHIISRAVDARYVLGVLDRLPSNVSRTIFIVGEENRMLGSLTDGDIRRGLLNGQALSDSVERFMNTAFKFLKNRHDNADLIKSLKKSDIDLVPILDEENKIVDIIDLKRIKTLLPLSALLMAGGRGERLRPYTDSTPKSLLRIGGKPIIEHNIDRLITFGISTIYISVKYLKEQIIDYLGDGSAKGVTIQYIEEEMPLGTIGSLSLIETCDYSDILVMNSDILTNIDFEDFYSFYKNENASMALASIPYQVSVPYAVLDVNDSFVSSFIEKPTFTYYSNGGIYILKYALKNLLKKDSFFNATDLMEKLIADQEHRLVHYPLLGYWLDIGRHVDYNKAQDDIKHIKL